jgi:hypothetical protein
MEVGILPVFLPHCAAHLAAGIAGRDRQACRYFEHKPFLPAPLETKGAWPFDHALNLPLLPKPSLPVVIEKEFVRTRHPARRIMLPALIAQPHLQAGHSLVL